MRGNVLATIAAVSFTLAFGNAHAQTFKETVIVFRKFEAKIKTGINYARYTESLADVEFAVGEYEANADELNKKNAAAFRDALSYYNKAEASWNLYIELAKISIQYDRPEYEAFPQVTDKYCPGVHVSRDARVDRCLDFNWNKAIDIVKDLHEIKKPSAGKKK